MSEEELLDKAENAVDVEDELAARQHEAAISVEDDVDDGHATDGRTELLLSPPVTGTSNIKRQSDGEEFMYLHLMDELPNGADTIPVPIPSRHEIHDESHELNRLLSWYGLNPDRVGDITGERIPLRPKGDYSDPEEMRFEVDYPPASSSGMARTKYRLRRLGERMGLLRWGRTPTIEYDPRSDTQWLEYRDGEHATAMPKSAHGLMHPRTLLPSDTEMTVPTHQGMVAAVAGIVAAGVIPIFVLASLGSIDAIGVAFLWMGICLFLGLPIIGFAIMGWLHHLKNSVLPR